MAKTKVKKKASATVRRPAAKPTPSKKKAPAKPAAKKASVAKKAAVAKKTKPAARSKPKVPVRPKAAAPAKKKSRPAAKKPVAARKPAAKAKAKSIAKPIARPAPARTPVAPSNNKRALAVSQRPQTAAVTLQTRPAPSTPVANLKARPAAKGAAQATAAITNDDQLRRAPDSAYMNDAQLTYFQERLLQMRSEVLTRELDVKERLHQREVFADPADRASAEEEHWLDLRLRERESLLLKKIDDALRRIRDRDYGYCEKTGEAIGIARLLARPTATVCVDVKGQDERAESQFRDR